MRRRNGRDRRKTPPRSSCAARSPPADERLGTRTVRETADGPISQKELVTAVTVAGIAVRYRFYLIGAITLALIAIAMTTIWNRRAHTIDEKAAFALPRRILAQLSVRSKVITERPRPHRDAAIRPDLRPQYGHDDRPDMPPDEPAQQSPARPAGHSRHKAAAQPPRVSNAFNHDMETRFGPMRAPKCASRRTAAGSNA